MKRIKGSENPEIEFYSNEDYEKFELVDFRTLRYQKKDNSFEEELVFDLESSTLPDNTV